MIDRFMRPTTRRRVPLFSSAEAVPVAEVTGAKINRDKIPACG